MVWVHGAYDGEKKEKPLPARPLFFLFFGGATGAIDPLEEDDWVAFGPPKTKLFKVCEGFYGNFVKFAE